MNRRSPVGASGRTEGLVEGAFELGARARDAAAAALDAAKAQWAENAPKVRDAIAGTPRAGGYHRRVATTHVDLVKNEWLAGYQVVVARARLGSHGLEIEASEPTWEEILRRPFGGIDPRTQPEAFLTGLADHVNGTYLFATTPHPDTECPFHDGALVRIQSTGESQAHPQAV